MTAIFQAVVEANRRIIRVAVRRPIKAIVLVGALAVLLGLTGGSVAVPSRAFASATLPGTATSSPAARAGAYGRLPLALAPNRGQFDPRDRDAARGEGHARA